MPTVYLDPAIDLRAILIINIRAQLVSNWRGRKAQFDPLLSLRFVLSSLESRQLLPLPAMHTMPNM